VNRLTAIAALLVALAPLSARAERGPSTPAERRRAIETTRKLEEDPLGRSANGDRKWLLQWIVEIPDIHVRGCSGPLDALATDEGGARYGKMLYAQSMFGMAAFIAANPKQAKDWVAVQTAGIESVLKAYRSLLRAEPQARWDELDLLLAARKQGKLQEVVEQTMDGCGDEAGPAPGEAI
jgi:hypothetical protein